jgi:hypothetical protein
MSYIMTAKYPLFAIASAKEKLTFMRQNPMACTWIDGVGWVQGIERVTEIAEAK